MEIITFIIQGFVFALLRSQSQRMTINSCFRDVAGDNYDVELI